MKKNILSEKFKIFENAVVNPSKIYGGNCPITSGPTSKNDTRSGGDSNADDCPSDDVKEDCPPSSMYM